MAMENATHSRGWMSGCTWYVRSFALVVLLLCIWATDISPRHRGSLNMPFPWPPCEILLSFLLGDRSLVVVRLDFVIRYREHTDGSVARANTK